MDRHRKTLLTCTWCGQEYYGRARSAHPCCSRECVLLLLGSLRPSMPSGEKNPNWKGGVSKQPYRYKKIQAQRNPQQIRARRAVHDAVKAGRLVRQCCEVCGDPKTHGHHDDYGKPLEVRWLCNKHHRALHRAIGTPHQ